jgi:ABC-type Mn2+/Zn2+ transport system permease subunit
MIRAFIDSWPLFGATYLAAWLLAALLALVGIAVVARDQIFLGAAITQTSLLGVGVALWLGYLPWGEHHAWLRGDWLVTGLAVGFAVATTLATFAGRGGPTPEGRVGWLYLLAGSLVILLLARTPVGLQELNQRLGSSLIGAGWREVGLAGGGLVLAGAAAWRWHRAAILLLTDRQQAAAVGLRVRGLETALAVSIGVVVGLALQTAGLLYAFGCLVLPGLVARAACREARSLFWAAPLAALAAAMAGFIIGNAADLPGGPLTVALLALALPVAAGWNRLVNGR